MQPWLFSPSPESEVTEAVACGLATPCKSITSRRLFIGSGLVNVLHDVTIQGFEIKNGVASGGFGDDRQHGPHSVTQSSHSEFSDQVRRRSGKGGVISLNKSPPTS